MSQSDGTIFAGTSKPTDLYMGSERVLKAYMGDTMVWWIEYSSSNSSSSDNTGTTGGNSVGAIVVSASGFSDEDNDRITGTYYIADESATGRDRIWRNEKSRFREIRVRNYYDGNDVLIESYWVIWNRAIGGYYVIGNVNLLLYPNTDPWNVSWTLSFEQPSSASISVEYIGDV